VSSMPPARRHPAARAARTARGRRAERGAILSQVNPMLSILVPFVLGFSACVSTPADAPTVIPQGQAVEAVYSRGGSTDFHDVDPVQARAASFGRVASVVDTSAWSDRLIELVPAFVATGVTPAASAPSLSADVVDADPLAARNWR
jgi:hypothetical protein